MKYSDYAKSLQNGSDLYVKEQLSKFNLGEFDHLKHTVLYRNIMNCICDEMDKRHLWGLVSY